MSDALLLAGGFLGCWLGLGILAAVLFSRYKRRRPYLAARWDEAAGDWVDEEPHDIGPDPLKLIADLERARSIAIALEQQLALATVLEIPRPGTGIPLQLRRSLAGGDRWAICDREGRRWDRAGYFVHETEKADEATRTDTRFPLHEALPLAQQIANGGAA